MTEVSCSRKIFAKKKQLKMENADQIIALE